MGDVAQILGDTKPRVGPGTVGDNGQAPSKAMKISGVSREVMTLLGGNQDAKSASLPPIVPTFNSDSTKKKEAPPAGSTATSASTSTAAGVSVKVGSKWISSSKPARPWTWAPFTSSSRTDGAMFRHWVRANVEYTDYPYAKFDTHLEAVTYTDNEYNKILKDDSWTRTETDKLMELARKYELRWPVIHDRWFGQYNMTRDVEDLQQRYYTIAATLMQHRITQEASAEVQALSSALPTTASTGSRDQVDSLLLESAAARAIATANPKKQPTLTNVGTGTSNKMFDVAHERERREHLNRLWNRDKAEEIEELQLRKELRLVEAQLRKLKKAGGHILAATQGVATGTGPNRPASASSSRNTSRSVSPMPGNNIVDSPDLLNRSFASTAPTPMPQTPYLQSGRLVPPATGSGVGVNKTLLGKMDQLLGELKVKLRPLPTKRVCDMYDSVRKDILTLLTLQKMLLQKEATLQARRTKLSKYGIGEKILDEEALLGIAPVPAPSPNPSTGGHTTKSTKSSKPSKSKGGGSSSSAKQKPSTPKSAKASEDSAKSDGKDAAAATAGSTTTGGKKAKTATKRKRKLESKSSAPAGATVPASLTPATSAASGKSSSTATTTGATTTTSKNAPAAVAVAVLTTATTQQASMAAAAAAVAASSGQPSTSTKQSTDSKPAAMAVVPSATDGTAAATTPKQTQGQKKRARKS